MRIPFRRVGVALAAAFLYGVGVIAWEQAPVLSASESNTAPPPPAQSEATIVAPGRLEPEGGIVRVNVPSDYGLPTLMRLLVKEGDWVRAGQVLAETDRHDAAQAAVDQAIAHKETIVMRLKRAREGALAADIAAKSIMIDISQAQEDFATTELSRANSLLERSATTVAARDEKVLADKKARLSLVQAVKERDAVIAHQTDEIAIATADLAEAEATITRATAELDRTLVTAPRAGQILKIYAKAGERLGDHGFCDLGDTSKLLAISEVYETDIERVRIGQKAIVTSRAFTEQLKGSVKSIALIAGRRSFEDIDETSPRGSRIVEVTIAVSDGQQLTSSMETSVRVTIFPSDKS